MKIIIALLLVLAGCAPRHPPAGTTDREMFDAHAGAFWDLQRQAWPPVTNHDGTVTPDASYWHESQGYEWLWLSECNDYVWTNKFPPRVYEPYTNEWDILIWEWSKPLLEPNWTNYPSFTRHADPYDTRAILNRLLDAWTNSLPVGWTNRCGPWPLNAVPAGASDNPFQP